MDPAAIVILSGLAIGLIYGAIGLVSGFCLMSSLRGWWADGDGRLVRTYALAMGTGVVASQLLAERARAGQEELDDHADDERADQPAIGGTGECSHLTPLRSVRAPRAFPKR